MDLLCFELWFDTDGKGHRDSDAVLIYGLGGSVPSAKAVDAPAPIHTVVQNRLISKQIISSPATSRLPIQVALDRTHLHHFSDIFLDSFLRRFLFSVAY